jgi:ABC-type polysaccharide/polyol phosphate export permease
LLGLISSLYFLSGVHYVLGMDVLTFSLTGVTTWVMFRQIVLRVGTTYVSARGLLNFEAVTPLMMAISQGMLFIAIYLGVFVILISIGYHAGLITLPIHWWGFVACVVVMGAAAIALGVLSGSIATRWRFFLRLVPVIERSLAIFSSVYVVSEQIPEQYRSYFLWSPFAHGMQLLRSAYFGVYEAPDASLEYFVFGVIFIIALSVGVERRARCHVQPM